MGLRTSIVVLVVGLILALAVTLQVQRIDLAAVGVCLIIGAVTGLIISGVQRVRRQPYAEWFAIGPWLLIVGLVMTQAIDLPQVTGIDLWMVGLIVLLVGLVVTLVAIYIVSPLRVSKTMRSAWSGEGPPEQTYRPQPYAPPALPSADPGRTYEEPTRRGQAGAGYDDGSAYGSSSVIGPTQVFGTGRDRGCDDRQDNAQQDRPAPQDRPAQQDRPGQHGDGGEPPTQQLPRS